MRETWSRKEHRCKQFQFRANRSTSLSREYQASYQSDRVSHEAQSEKASSFLQTEEHSDNGVQSTLFSGSAPHHKK